VCGDGCGCGIGMEIRYPYWAHSATGSRDPGENAHGARPALAARPALCSNAYLDCCTGPALAAWSEPGSTNYRGAGPACRAGAQVRTTFCCAGLALAARRCDSFLPCSLLPTGLRLAGEDWKDSSLTAVGSVRSRPHVCSGMHYARPTAGVEPTPLSGPPGVRQGASGAGSVARAWQWPCGPTPLW
jgi:hypothetical protein